MHTMKKNQQNPQRKYHNVREMLDRVCWENASKPAFFYKQGSKYRSITYARLRSDVRSLGASLTHRGLCGKKIILIGENSYPWCLTYLTALCGLGVIIPVDKETPKEDLCNIAKVSSAAAVVYSKKYEDKAEALPKKLQKITFDELFELCEQAMSFTDKELHAPDMQSIDIDELAALAFTSGTTGTTKGVMLSQRNICASLDGLRQALANSAVGTTLAILPLHYIYESIAGLLLPLSRGGAVAFSEEARSIMRNAKETNPTSILCNPQLIEKIYKKIYLNIKKNGIEEKVQKLIKTSNAVKIPALRKKAKKKLFAELHNSFGGELDYFMVSGGPIDPQAISGLREFGFTIVRSYGLAESTALITVSSYKDQKDLTDGKVLSSGEIKIENPDSRGAGEICYRGDNVMLGYYKHEDISSEIKKNGWIHTGDIGTIDEDGNLTVLGRKKNAIIPLGGKAVFPEELEFLISRSPFVKECAVIGLRTEQRRAPEVCAVVFPDYIYSHELLGVYSSRPMVREKLSAVISEINAHLPAYKKITRLVLLDEEIPKSPYKKIMRSTLPEYVLREYVELDR